MSHNLEKFLFTDLRTEDATKKGVASKTKEKLFSGRWENLLNLGKDEKERMREEKTEIIQRTMESK